MGKDQTFKSTDTSFILDNLNTAVFRTSIDGTGAFIDVNPAFLQVFGYESKAQLESIAVIDLYADPEDRDAIREELRSKGLCREREIFFKRRNGEIFPGRVSSVLVKDEVGQALYIDGVVDDITTQRQQAQALKESESKSRAMADAASEAVLFFHDCHCTESNQSASRIFGYSSSEFESLDLKTIFAQEFHEKLGALCISNESEALRVIAHRKSGESFPAECIIRSFVDQGQPVMVCTIADLSTQEEALAELQDRQLELLEERRVFFGGPVIQIQWPLGEAEPLKYISDNVKQILGYEVSDFTEGRILYPEIVHDADRSELQDAIRTMLQESSEIIFVRPYRLKKKSGEYIWVQDYGYVQRDEAGKPTAILGYIYDVTDQQESHRRIVESESRYRDLVENSPTGILRIDLKGNILDVNTAMVKSLGSPSAEATKSFNMFTFQPLVDAGISQKFQDVIREDNTAKFTSKYTSVWDKIVHFDIVIHPVHNAERQIIGAQANMEDISNTYYAEIAKHEMEQAQLEERNIFMAGPIMILKWDMVADKPLLQMSENVEDILGYSVAEMLNGTVLFVDIIHPDDIDRARATAQKARDEGLDSFDTLAYRIRCKNGKYIWVNDHSTIIREENGAPKYISGIVYDISHLIEAEEELKLNEETYRELFNAISEAVFIHDLDTYKILDVNETMLRMYGYERHEVIGADVQEFSATADVAPDVANVFKLAISRGQKTIEWEAKHKDGHKFWAEVTLRPAMIHGKNRMLANVRNIANRKKILSELELSLREQEVLLREVHHRVKNNMQVISSLLNLQAEYTQDERLFEIFGETQNRIRTMALIHEKLFKSKSMSAVDFGNYLHSLVSDLINFYSIDRRKIQIHQSIDTMKLDITKAIPCGLIVNELITNAFKYAFPDNREGSIWLTVKAVGENSAEIQVKDNGIGVNSDLDINTTQTMGLRIVRILTEQLQGSIQLDLDQGVCFTLSFKLTDDILPNG